MTAGRSNWRPSFLGWRPDDERASQSRCSVQPARHEGTGYLKLLRRLHALQRPRSYLEIGTAAGKTLTTCTDTCVYDGEGSLTLGKLRTRRVFPTSLNFAAICL